MPPKAIIERCARLNPHGFGFATKDKIFKTLSFAEFSRAIKTIPQNETVILHFRYATHGSIKTENCHPFRDENTGVSFAHNGVLDIVPYEDMTDSETAFRGYLVPEIETSGLFSRELYTKVQNIIGGSRFAFIDKDGEINLFGRFVEYGDCWYSNENFMPFVDRFYHSQRKRA